MSNLILNLAFGAMGLLFIGIAFVVWMRTREFISKAQETKGIVVRMLSKSGSKGGIIYAPVYQFRTIDGRTIEVEESIYSKPPQFQEGQSVDILYDPQNPEKARVKKWMNLYFPTIVLAGMGVIFVGIGIVSLISYIRNL
jgi:Protein of unknown function (DUF3592)